MTAPAHTAAPARATGPAIGPAVAPAAVAMTDREQLLREAEQALEQWIRARAQEPTRQASEGFRLLALHRQGARGAPSFNACREIAYHYNLLGLEADHPQAPHRLRMMQLLVRHLQLFVSGKLEVAGLGEFCCSSRPLRAESGSDPTGGKTDDA